MMLKDKQMTLDAYFDFYQKHLEQQLQQVLPASENPLHQAMTYSVLNGGKRFRPVLIYATAEALKIPTAAVDSMAVAIEIIHCYSLIHDDLPAMDNDDYRRGKPTCHRQFNEAIAILAGDTLQTLAIEVLAKPNSFLTAQQQLETILILTHASGHHGMAYGQALDIQSKPDINVRQLEEIHVHKTGKLIKACLELVLVLMNHNEQVTQNLLHYGDCLGLAFQVQDDILDVEGVIDTLGKLPGSDARLQKATYPSIVGMPAAKRILNLLYEEAMKALREIHLEDSRLGELAKFVVKR
jgi:geranylgeranyl pyrophosphate synthase